MAGLMKRLMYSWEWMQTWPVDLGMENFYAS